MDAGLKVAGPPKNHHVFFSSRGSLESYTLKYCYFQRIKIPTADSEMSVILSRIPNYLFLLAGYFFGRRSSHHLQVVSLFCSILALFMTTLLPPVSLARMILSSGQTNHISHKPQTRAVV